MTCAGAGPEVSPEGFREAACRGWGSSLRFQRFQRKPPRSLPGGQGWVLSELLAVDTRPLAFMQLHRYNFFSDLEGEAGSTGYKGSKSWAGQRNRGNLKY